MNILKRAKTAFMNAVKNSGDSIAWPMAGGLVGAFGINALYGSESMLLLNIVSFTCATGGLFLGKYVARNVPS